MKASYKVNSKVIIELEAGDQKDLFEQLASLGEVFGQTHCGKCKKENLKFVVRTDKDENKYYCLDCQDCNARLSFGANKKGGTLFVKRKDKEDNWLKDSGWTRWNSTTKSLE